MARVHVSRLHHLLLLVCALPFIYDGLGCEFDQSVSIPLDPVPEAEDDNNAYVCACDCETGSRFGSFAIAAGNDDAEEFVSNGDMLLDGIDLDFQSTDSRIVGLRFAGLGIPQGATVLNARLQFSAIDDSSGSVSVIILAEKTGSAAPFANVDDDLSDRFTSATNATSLWPIPSWTAGDSGAAQLSPNLAGVLNEVIGEPDWSGASPLVLLIDVVSGSGMFEAYSFEEDANLAAELLIEWQDDSVVSYQLTTCMPPDLNPNVDGSGVPDKSDLAADCRGRVEDTLSDIAGTCGYAGRCDCDIVNLPNVPDESDFSYFAEECNDECVEVLLDSADRNGDGNPDCSNFDPVGGLAEANATADSGPVCLAQGGQVAALVGLSQGIYGNENQCEVEGEALLLIGDDVNKRPDVGGLIRFSGELCSRGEVCDVGISYLLGLSNVEISVKWASNPVFRDLGAAGGSEKLQLFGDSGIGIVAPDDSLTSIRGRRGSNDNAWLGSNSEGLVFTVIPDFDPPICEFDGSLASTVETEDPDVEGSEPFDFSVDVHGVLVNQPPNAVACVSQTVECTSPAGARFALDASESSDPDSDIAVMSWRRGSRTGDEVGYANQIQLALSLGETETFVIRAVDSFGQADEDATTVSVVDTVAPAVTCPAPIELECTSPAGATAEFESSASDVCDASVSPSCDPASGSTFPLGSTEVTCSAEDDSGNEGSCDFDVSVVDAVPPVIDSLSASPDTLWVANHKMVSVSVGVVVQDVCDAMPACRIVAVSSNEMANGKGDGSTSTDIDVTGDLSVDLRAERAGQGSGRVYTIQVECSDASGNTASAETEVRVAHDQR